MSGYTRELKLYDMMLSYCHKLVQDLDDATLRAAVGPGLNHPLWILGHLSTCTDIALQLLGRPTRCPTTWHQWFGPGSDPGQVTAPPDKQMLLNALTEGHAQVAAALKGMDEERLQEPHSIAFLATALPTKAELIAHILTTHEAMHLGQLSAWRRSRGLRHVL
jgi:hypothetical protein